MTPRSIAAAARELPPEALLVGAALSVQVGASIATGLLASYAPVSVVALRLAFGALLLLVLGLPRRPATGARGWWNAVALGAVFVGMNSSFYLAISRIPLGVAVTIEFWGPLAIAVLGSRRPRDLAWAALAAVGIYLLAGDRLEASDALGVIAALCAGAGWFLFVVTGTRVARDWPDGQGLTVALVFGSLFAVPIALAIGDLGRVVGEARALAGGLVVALFSSALPWSLEIAAMSRMRRATYGVLVSLEPAIAAVAGFVLLGQVLRPPELVAIVLVGVASAGASLAARQLRTAPGELEAE